MRNAIIAILLSLGSVVGCVTTTNISNSPWPKWADDVSKVCSQMATRNVDYIAKYKAEDVECPTCGRQERKDQQIIESDTRFMLGLIEHINKQRILTKLGR